MQCPHCGEEIRLDAVAQESETVRCEHCGREVSVPHPAQAEEAGAADAAIRELAQQYFADIPDAPAAKSGAPEAASAPEAGKDWSFEDDIGEEDKLRQREKLFQFAQATAQKPKEEPAAPREAEPAQPKKISFREKGWQRGLYWVLLLLVFLLPAARILLSRRFSPLERFNWLQPQMTPSLLYFFAAAILLFPLLRHTAKPRPVSAVLLLLPLILDFWYLIPGIGEQLPPNTLLQIGSGVKLAAAAFALLMSFRARKHPAL